MSIDRKITTFKTVNNIAAGLIYVICVLVIIFPYIPAVKFYFQKNVAHQEVVAAVSDIDQLIIPKINVKKEIVEADNIGEVHEKVWIRPQGSTPDKGSNTVLVAHRYATIGGDRASTFYNLPDLVVGDSISLNWKGKLYTYTVFETKVVEPTAIEIENPTVEPILTLYTCTPLWTAAQRFVVIAKLTSVQ